MRPFFLLVLIAIAILSWNAPATNPLQHTQWAGTVNAPDAMDGIFTFTADTTTLYVGGSPVETSLYKVNGDTLKLIKLNGMSSCGGSDTGYYKYTIKDSVLTITPQKDNCMDRSNAFSNDGYKQMRYSF